MNATKFKLFLLGLAVCAHSATNAVAGSMNYGDHMGDRVTYEDVREDNNQGPDTLLYSMPKVVGDSLQFDPVNFFSEVNPGPGSDIVDAQMSANVVAKDGFTIKRIEIHEAGDYTIIGLPGASAQANVGAAFFWTAFNAAGDVIAADTTNMQFNTGGGPNGGEHSSSATARIWQGWATLDLEGLGAARVELTFDNSLATAAAAGASAFIKKKEIGGILITPVIPEPTSIALLVLAGIGLAVRRRR